MAARPSVSNGDALLVIATARLSGRDAVARVVYFVDAVDAAAVGCADGDRSAEAAAEAHAGASARCLAHAVELAGEAGGPSPAVPALLDALVAETAASSAVVVDADGVAVAGAGRPGSWVTTARRGSRPPPRRLRAPARVSQSWSPGPIPSRACAMSRRSRHEAGTAAVAVSVLSRARSASLVETAWQVEVDRLAALEGISGVWLDDARPPTPRLVAAAPRPGGTAAAADAWDRWSHLQVDAARAALAAGAAVSTVSLDYLRPDRLTILSAAPLHRASGSAAVVVEHVAGDDIRSVAVLVVTVVSLVVVFSLAAVLVGGLASRRFIGAPVEALAAAAVSIGTAGPSLRASSGRRRTGPATARTVPGSRAQDLVPAPRRSGEREPRPPSSQQYAHLVLRAPRSRVTASPDPARAWHISARAPKRGGDDAEDVVRDAAGRLEQQSALDGAASKVGSRWWARRNVVVMRGASR